MNNNGLLGNDGALLGEIKEFIRVKCDSRDIDRFPGPQPVSIEKKHIPLLSRNSYLVCEKTDGVRHFLVCFTDSQNRKICALVNRSFEFTLFPLTVPRNTILDGELLGSEFIIHDAMWIQGEDVRQMNLVARLSKVKQLVKAILPIQKLRVTCKHMIPYRDMKNLKLGEHNDGVIFTPVDEPVRMGTHRTLFKWKPFEKITIDFLFTNGHFYIQCDGKLVNVRNCRTLTTETENSIYECVYNGSIWEPIKKRTDKSHPNNKRTYERTMINIHENIKICELVPQ
jgi:hypothetical protein